MNKRKLKTQCNSDNLELFLCGVLSPAESEILELYLTECETCEQNIWIVAEQGASEPASDRIIHDVGDSITCLLTVLQA